MCDPSGMGRQFTAPAGEGRSLDVYVDGPDDAIPLLFHNGTPSTGELFSAFVQAAAERGLRMVGFSRAGYGNSTRNPGRRVADVVPDVVAVLDALGAARFYTLGWSGGGPHALACAALLPGRLIACATVGGLAPRGADGLDWMAGMGDENVAAFSAADAGEAALMPLAEAVGPSFAAVTPADLARRLGSLVSEVDRPALGGEAARWLAEVFQASVHNGPWGWYDDELALVAPWGFEVDAIRGPVAVWQGGQDRMTPFAHGEWLASHLPGAHAHLLPDEGHLSLGVDSFGLILDDLLAIGSS